MTRRGISLFSAAFALLCATRFLAAAAPVGEALVPIPACRALDTRGGAPLGGPALAAGEVRLLPFTGACGVPSNALGLVVNLTVVHPTALGFAQLFAGDAPPPPTTVLNFPAGRTRAGFAFVALASDATGIKLANASLGSADYLLDVLGYFIPACTATITVTNPATSTGTIGAAFSQTFTSAGGTGTTTFTTASPLPGGLTLAANGTLSGTPTHHGTFPITVVARDANGCTGTGQTYTLVIACQTITVTNPGVATGTANTPFSQTFTQTGGVGTTTFSTSSPLPIGMTLAANGVLSGTPTQAGAFPITVLATDADGCTGAGATYNLVIGCQAISVTNPAVAAGIAGQAFSQTFTQAGAIGSATFTVASGILPAGLALAANGTLSGTPLVVGSFPVTVKVTDGNLCTGTGATYTLVIGCQPITVTNPGTTTGTVNAPFSQTFTQGGAIGSATFTTASTLPAGLTLAANGTLSGTPTQSGSFPITVTVTDGNGCTGTGATYTLVVACQTYTVNPAALAQGTTGVPYAAVTFTQAGGVGAVTFAQTGALPNGMSFTPGAATLAGTPTQSGSFPITVTATDANGCTASRDYLLVVVCSGSSIALSPASLPAVVVNVAFPATVFSASGGTGPYTFAKAGVLPAGMSFNPGTATLDGTPTETGTFPITISATDTIGGCVGSQDYVINVTCNGVTITVNPPTIPPAPAGAPYGPVTFTAVGGTGPYTFAETGALPSGMTFSGGVLSGTPTQSGTFALTVTAKDAAGCVGPTTYSLVITCPVITVTNPGVASGTVSTPFSQTFTQTGGAGTVTFSLASGTLPNGLTLSSAGVLSGTPTQSGSFPVTVKATDANGCTGTGPTYTLVVSCQTITVTNPIVNSGVDGAPYLQTFTQTGAIGGATFSLASGVLPSGWSLTPAGVLANAAPTPVSFSITVRVTDGNGCTGTGVTYVVAILPAAANDTYAPAIVGNMSIDTSTGTVFSVLTNDSAGTTAALFAPAAHGTVVVSPSGTFTYAPDRGYQGPDTFQYRATHTASGLVSAPATVSLTVTGVVWFVNDNPGACAASCDGRNATPYTTLAAFQAVNDGVGANPKASDSIFLYESNPPNPYVGPVTLLNGQRLIGQDFSGTFASATGLAVPDTTVAVPVMNAFNGPVTEVTNGPGLNAINLVTDAAVIGLKATASSGRAISQALAPPAVGAAPLGTTTLSEVNIQTTGTGTALAVFSTTGFLTYPTGSIGASGSNGVSAVFIQGGSSAITIGVPITSNGAGNISISQRAAGATTTFNGPVLMTGAATGIAIGGLSGAGTIAFNASVQLGTGPGSRMTGAGGIALDVNHSGTASTTSFANLSVFTNNMTGVNAQTSGTLNIATGSLDVTGGRALSVSNVALGITLSSITQAGGSGGAPAISLTGSSGFLTSAVTSLSNASTQGVALSSAAGTVDFGSTTITSPGSQGILVSGSTANVNFGNTIVNGGTDAVSLQNNSNGSRTFGTLTIGNTAAPSGIGFLHAVGGGNTTVSGAATITNPGGLGVSIEGLSGTQAINFNSTLSVTKSAGTAVALGTTASNSLAGTVNLGVLSVSASNGTAILTGSGATSTPLTTSGAGLVTATNGPAINATNTTFNASFGNVSSTNSTTQGVTLTNAVGTLSMNGAGGSITGAAGTAFNLSGGTANVTYAGSITQNAAQFAVAAASMTGGTKTFSGNITSNTSGKGISLTSNTGATIAFSGGLNLSTGTNPAFTATGPGPAATSGGTVTATGTNTLATTTGTALNVTNTTIGAANLTFQSINSPTASGNAGIVLNNTGASGGLVVTGTGTTAGSGGTISNKSTHGISLTSTSGTTLKNMNLTSNATSQSSSNIACGNSLVAGDTTLCTANLYMKSVTGAALTNLSITGSSQQGIAGTSVAGLTLADSTISGNGNEDYENGFLFKNLTGTVSITNTTVRDNFSRQAHVYNDAGSMTLTVAGSRFGRNVAPGVSSQQGMLIELAGTSHADVDLGTSTIDNNGNGNGLAIAVTASASLGSSGTHSSLHNMTSLTGNAAHVFMSTAGSSVAFFDTLNNGVMTAAGLQAIDYFAPGGSLTGVIQNNTIGTSGVPASACSAALAGCDGMTIDQTGSGLLSLRIQSNTLQQVNTNGISLGSDFSNNVSVSIVNNVIRQPSNSAPTNSQGNAFFLNIGISSNSVAGSTACVNFTGNTIQDTATNTWDINGSGAAVFSNTRHNAITRLPGAWGSGTAAAQTFLGANNTFNLTGFGGTAPALVLASTGGTIVSGAACSVP